MFFHAIEPEHIKVHHLQGQVQVAPVDSVINNGSTILKIVEPISELRPDIRIAVVAGVIQAQCISSDSTFYRTLANHQMFRQKIYWERRH